MVQLVLKHQSVPLKEDELLILQFYTNMQMTDQLSVRVH